MFTNTKNYSTNRISILVYGPSGSGKTTLAKSLPGKTLIINAENGLLSLSGSDIDVYDITVDKKGAPLSQDLRFEKLNYLLTMLKSDEFKSKYQWLVFDSLTEIAQNLVYYLQKLYPDRKDTMKLWGDYNKMLTELVKGLRDFKPYNILMFALDTIDKDEEMRRFVGINVNGKISERLPALLDEVFYLKKYDDKDGNTKRCLITETHESIIAKDRSGKLDKFEMADMGAIINKITKD